MINEFSRINEMDIIFMIYEYIISNKIKSLDLIQKYEN